MATRRPFRLRLFDILDAIAGVERLIGAANLIPRPLNADEYRAVERYVEIISEASRSIPDELKAQAPSIPWQAIADIGNIIRHAYDRVDQATIDDIANHDLPELKAAVTQMYADNKNQADPWP